MIRSLTGLLGGLALVAVAAVAALALFGNEDLLLAALKDDGFYFLALARSVAHGQGATFDGLGPTNGFHPLWLLLLTPIFWIDWGSLLAPVRAMLLLSLGLHLVAAALIQRICGRVFSRPAARLAALAYVANPLVLYLVVSGMESPAVAVVVAGLCLEVVRILRREQPETPTVAFRLGAAAGLCMLARTDLALLAACAFAAVLLLPRPPAPSVSVDRGGRERGRRLRFLIPAAATALAVVAPWIIWNWIRFGSVVQVSARAHHLHSVSLRAPGEPEGAARLLQTGSALFAGVFGALSARAGVPAPLAAAALGAVAGLLAWWIWAVLAPREPRREALDRLRLLAAPVLYALGFLGAAIFLLGHIRSWYLAGPLTVGGVLCAWPLDQALRPSPSPRRARAASAWICAGLLAAGAALGTFLSREILENGRRTSVWREAVNWVEVRTVPGERVASFNSGTFGYLSPRPVVNLDCVVNNRALPFLERRQLVAFLERERIRFLIDDRWYVTRYFGSYGEPGWRGVVVPVDTLPRGLVAYEIRRETKTPASESPAP